jgi:hypothetical protein
MTVASGGAWRTKNSSAETEGSFFAPEGDEEHGSDRDERGERHSAPSIPTIFDPNATAPRTVVDGLTIMFPGRGGVQGVTHT